jgi:hypothetical protein
MASPILARADALMQRRRQNGNETDDVPILTDAVDMSADELDDDVPVLLDIEPFAPLSEADPIAEEALPTALPAFAAEPAAEPAFNAALRDILAHELSRRVEQRLLAELPRIIESTVRDYLAEQQMIDALQQRD